MGNPSPSSRRHHLARPLPHPRLAAPAHPPRATVYVVERLGRFSRLLRPAPDPAAPLLPLVDKVVAAYTTRRVAQATPPAGLLALAAARLHVHVHAVWAVRVTDPKRLAYRIADVDRCIHMLVHLRIRDALAALPPHALSALSAPDTLAPMSDAVHQNVHHTASDFGVACSALTITAIHPLAPTPTPTPALADPRSSPLQNTPARKPRSLHLADPDRTDFNDFEMVLPELPDRNSPTKLPLPPKLHSSDHHRHHNRHHDNHNDNDDNPSLDDSSTENRPENTPVAPKLLRPTPPPPKDVLYAPPPSPTNHPSKRLLSAPTPADVNNLPALISKAIPDNHPSAHALHAHSSHDHQPSPPPPPSPKLSPPSPPPPPLSDPNTLTRDFTPDLAQYLDGLPPTPPSDLPSSDTSSDMPEDAQAVTAPREMPDDTVCSLEARLSRAPDEMDQTDEMDEKSTPGGTRELHEPPQKSLPEIASGSSRNDNPFDSVEPVESVEAEEKGVQDEKGMLMQSTSTPTNPPSPESAPVEEDSDDLSSTAVMDKDVDSFDEASSSRLLPEPSVDSVGLPVGSSVNREPRRRRQQQPTTSVFQSVMGKAERAIKSATSDLMDGPMRLINPQGNTSGSADAPADGLSVDGRRGAAPPGNAQMNGPKPATWPAPRRMDEDRNRSVPAMADNPHEGDRLSPPQMPMPTPLLHYPQPVPKVLPPPIPTPIYAPQTEAFPPSVSNYSSLPDFSDSSRERLVFRAGMPPSHQDQEDQNRRMMRKDRTMDERKNKRDDSGLRSRKEEEALASKERMRREKLMDTIDNIEKSQSDGNLVSVAPARENREVWAEAASDSDQEVFFDAKDSIAPPPEASASSEPRHPSRRRNKSRHSRKSSRYENDYKAESSSSEGECAECSHCRYESYKREDSHSRKGKSRSRSESARRRTYDGNDSDSEGFSDYHSSRSRSRNEKRSGDGHRSEYSEHSSRDKPHRNKKSSSRERKIEKPERLERTERSERRERRDRAEKAEMSERSVLSEKSEREQSSRRNRSDRKRTHEKDRSRSSKKSSREVEPEHKRREPKSRSKKKHKRPPSPPTLEYFKPSSNVKPIYRHRLPDSDSGIENPIPWYCEGQSAPDDTDIDLDKDYSSDSETNMMDSTHNTTTTTTTYSSYGRRDRNGRRHKAHHTRSVTFLYDDL